MERPRVGDVDHDARHGPDVLVLPRRGRPCPGSQPIGGDKHGVHLLQQDDVDVDDDGQVRVMRTPPVIAVEEHRLTLRGAARLRGVLDELLELAWGTR
jgi:hypothetical protein